MALYRDVVRELAPIPNVAGLKFTDTNLDELHYLKTEIQPPLNVVYGSDETLAAGLLMGADDPVCQAGAVRYTLAVDHGRDRVLFSNAASLTGRQRITVRLSHDECRTWPVGRRVLHAGPSAYSDLAVAPDLAICCFYERGAAKPYETLTLARFDLQWLTDGADRL